MPVPRSLAGLSATPDTCVVFRYRSIFLEALLESIAYRGGFRKAQPLSTGQIIPGGRTDEILYTSIQEGSRLHKFFSASTDTRFVTFNLFHGRGPIRYRPGFKMRVVDLLSLIIGPLVRCRCLCVLFGKPFRPDSDNIPAKRVMRTIKLDFYRNLKLVRGTPFQPYEVQRRAVIGGKDFDKTVAEIADRLGIRAARVHRMARKEFQTIAARPQAWAYIPADILSRIILKRLFTQIETRGLERFKKAVQESTVVLVPTHRSHLDYVLLGSVLYRSNLNPALIAAGINLSFWPAGPIARRLGAYFVRRDARDFPLHGLILKRYVTYLIKRGHLQEFFIEGGRSRNGKMRAPRFGLLSVFISAYLRGLRKDILFVPVSISYEQVIEDHVFGDEDSGKEKRKESIFSLIKARKMLRQKYGDVVITFGDPVSTADFCERFRSLPVEQGPDKRKLISSFALEIVQNIRAQLSIPLTSLTCTALMSAPDYGLTKLDLEKSIKNLATLAEIMRKVGQLHGDYTPEMRGFLEHKVELSPSLFKGDVIVQLQAVTEELYAVPEHKRFIANFYRNMTVHLFVPHALLAVLDLLERDLRPDECKPLYSLFSFDQQLPPWSEFEKLIADLVTEMLETSVLEHSDTRIRYRNRATGLFIPSLLLDTLQALRWVYLHLNAPELAERLCAGGENPLKLKEFINILLKGSRGGRYLGHLQSAEAVTQSGLHSIILSLEQRGVIALQTLPDGQKLISIRSISPEELALLDEVNQAILAWQLNSSQ